MLALAAVMAIHSVAVQRGTTERLPIRGQPQTLRLYGERGRAPVIVSSGDGGWTHLAPHVAEALAARGFFVVGFDVRAYLSSFTSGKSTLRAQNEPADYHTLVTYAARGSTTKPILIGISEGAGLSVLAATDPKVKASITGVIGLGLPVRNELGWRWRDSLVYLTHGVPDEPGFDTTDVVDHVSPVPLAAIHSSRDEFVSVPEVQHALRLAKEPKRLWIVNASDHRFSDNEPEFDRRLLDAVEWVRDNAAR